MNTTRTHQDWATQIERQAEERRRWRQVLAPEMRTTEQPYATTRTGIHIGSAHQRPHSAAYATGVHGPYRRRGTRARRALAGLVAIAAVVALALLAGCSPASDTQIDRLIAEDLQAAVEQAAATRP